MIDRLGNNGLIETLNTLPRSKKEKNDNFIDFTFGDLLKPQENLNSSQVEIKSVSVDPLTTSGNFYSTQQENEFSSPDEKKHDVLIENNEKTSHQIELKADEQRKNRQKTQGNEKNSLDEKNRMQKEQLNKPDNLESLIIKSGLNINFLGVKNLDFAQREQVRSIIDNFKSGKISENIARQYITRIIKNAGQNNLIAVPIIQGSKNIKDGIKINSELDDSKKKGIHADITDEPLLKKSDGKEKILEKKTAVHLEKNAKNDASGINISLNNELKNHESRFELQLNLDTNQSHSDNNSAADRLNRGQSILENNRQNLFQELAKNTKIVLGNELTKFSTMIRPENFGRIDMSFTVKDGKVNGRLILQNQETADFFRANVEELKAVFQKANVEMGNLDIIQAGTRFTDFNSGQNNQQDSAPQEFILSSGLIEKNREVFDENIEKRSGGYDYLNNRQINLVI